MITRTVTIAIVVPALIFVIGFLDEKVFFAVALLVGILALLEFFAMALPAESTRDRLAGIVLGGAVLTAAFLSAGAPGTAAPGRAAEISAAMVLCLIVLSIYHVWLDRDVATTLNRLAVKVFGIFYIAFLLSFVILIRARADGVPMVFFLLVITWAGDIGAYLVGTWKGKTFLCPSISPKKTVEGAGGGLAASLAAAFLCRAGFLPQLGFWPCLALGAGINFLNQFGDLIESMIKRACGVKDSGSIMPGHGGMLDRIDSILLAAPFLYYYVTLLIPHP